MLLAVAIVWYALDHWLIDLAYRIHIPWWASIVAGLLAIGVALLTVGFFKASKPP